MEYIYDDICHTSKITHILHSCNCVTNHAMGLAKQIFDTYPESFCYDQKRTTGTIQVVKVGDNKYVVNMFAQYYPRHAFPSEKRIQWFDQCLEQCLLLCSPDVVFGFPYRICCGYGGGDWGYYEKRIERFAEDAAKLGAKAVIVMKK